MVFRFPISFAAALAGLLIAMPVQGQVTTNASELHLWWSAGRQDNAVSSSPQWRGGPGQSRTPDYTWVGRMGRIYGPDAGELPGLRPLHSWFDAGRGDNFTTGQTSWRGSSGQTRSPNYRWYRLEGYVHDRPIAGTIPLVQWYDRDRGDNHLTTQLAWLPTGRSGERRSPNYGLVQQEGWMLPWDPAVPHPDADPSVFGYASEPVSGRRPLLVITVDYDDKALSQPDSFYRNLVFGPNGLNVVDNFTAMSNGLFTFAPADFVRINGPDTATVLADVASWDQQVLQRAAESGFDYARFDADGDGVVRSDELAVLIINPNYDANGDGRGDATAGGNTRAVRAFRASGKLIRLTGSFADEMGDIKLPTHELLHQLGDAQDMYGPDRTLNYRASVMAGMTPRSALDAGPVELDSYNAMRFGWVRPRVVAMTKAGGVARIAAAQANDRQNQRAPVLFYDPARGMNEFFIAQHRTALVRNIPDHGYDAAVKTEGLALWYVNRQPDGRLTKFFWPGPFSAHAANGDAVANYYISTGGNAIGPLLSARDGIMTLRWGDGTDSGMRLQVGTPGPSTVDIQWFHRDQPFLPRIDAISAVRADRSFDIRGIFPIAPLPAHVGLARAGAEGMFDSNLEIVSRSNDRITARLPAGIQRGTYLVSLRQQRGRLSTTGNWARLTVP